MQPLQGYNAAGFKTGSFTPNELYNGQEASKGPGFTSKAIIGMDEIREIVEKLNAKPFDENLTLVTFDDLTPLELLTQLNKVMAHIDPQQEVSLKSEPQEKTADRITEFLRVMNYPGNLEQ